MTIDLQVILSVLLFMFIVLPISTFLCFKNAAFGYRRGVRTHEEYEKRNAPNKLSDVDANNNGF